MNNYPERELSNYPDRRILKIPKMRKRTKAAIVVTAVVTVLLMFQFMPVKIGVIVNDTLVFGNIEYESDHQFTVSSNIFIKVIHADGTFDEYEGSNVICDDALITLKVYISDTPGNAYLYIGVGTGSGGNAASTDLVTPYSTRGLGTYSSVSDAVFKIVYTFPATFFADTAITETGLFNAVTGVTMFNYHDFSSITLSASDSLEMTHQITLASA